MEIRRIMKSIKEIPCNMTSIIGYQLIFFLLLVPYIDAQVTIVRSGMNTGTETFECGESLLLTCQIDAYSISMTWQNDSSPTPIAECVQSTCVLDQTTVGLFEFSYDTNSGIFNLTIVQLTLDNNGTTYMCEDGSASASAAITVDDYQPIVDESTYGKILVTSGCIDPNTDVKFQWKIVKVDTGRETSYIPKGDALNITACLDEIICGPSYFVQRTESIIVEPDGDYRLKVILTYDNKRRVESNPTNGKYKVEEQADACDTGCKIGIVIGSLVVIHIILGGILIVVLRKRAKKRNKILCTCICYTKKCLLIVLSAIPLIGISTVFGSLICLCCCGKKKSSHGKGESPTEELSKPKSKTAALPDIHAVNNQQNKMSDSAKRRGNKKVDQVIHKIKNEAEVGNVLIKLIHKKEDNANGTENNARKYVNSSRQQKPRKSPTQAAKKHTIPGVGDQSQSQTTDENQRRHVNLVQNKITTNQGSEHKTESPDEQSNSKVSGNASQGKEFPEKLNDETRKQNKNTPVSDGAPAGKVSSHDTPVQNKITTKQGSEHKSYSLEEHSNSTVSGNASQYPEKVKDGSKKQSKNIPVSEGAPAGNKNSHVTLVQNKITTKQGSEHKSDSLEKHSNSTVSGNASQGIEYSEKGKDGTKKQNKTIPASEGTPTGLETQQTDLSANFTDANDATARVSDDSTNM